ncbi:phosphotransferase [Spongiibacter sp. KMU-166]|uniref:Phosphotransferase n=1 Tax=Spongiibacter thalassae TaxID=2721624 RepID=A0ABX1GDA5_9GAMM|nr:phosphotransferase [Spongiibacter thalassae]NKI16568.1 phosphotransferase [Spongiibacter thalassae]
MTKPQPSFSSDTYHQQALVALADADRSAALAPELTIDGPHTMADVTPEWIEQSMATNIDGAALVKMHPADEHSGMTSRVKWQLEWNPAGQQAGLPTTVFVKSTPAEPAHREMLSVLHMHDAEVNFYLGLQPELSDIAPKIWYGKAYAGGRFLLAMEDLEASGSKPFWLKDQVGIEHMTAVATSLAILHSRYWESPRLQTDLAWARPRTCRFGWPWLNDMTKQVRGAFMGMANNTVLPDSAREVLALWQQHADTAFDYFDTLPRTVLHGDSHVGNTYRKADGSAGLFDWQVVFSGHGLRDLAYFLHSAMSEEERLEHEQSVFDHYLSEMAARGIKLDRDTCWNLYCLFVLDRWDAAITAFVHGSYNHDREAQLRGLQATRGCIQQHNIGDRLLQLVR